MEKALELLENYCQWLAVAIGGLFLAWMLWAYVLLTPVAVPDGSATLTPGDVDETIAKNHADPLDQEMRRPDTEKPPVMANASPLDKWLPLIKDGTDKPITTLASSAFASPTAVVKLGAKGNDELPANELVTQLPTLPSAAVSEVFAKRVRHGEPPPPAPAAGQPQPPAPAPVAVAPGQIAPGKDISYVRLSYRIPTEEIGKSFQAVNVPPGVGTTTTVVAIKLLRQEQFPDGTWSEPTEVPYLKNNVFPYPLPKGPQEVNWFRSWSDSPQGQNDLLRPLFYPVVAGEGPWDPSMDDQIPKYDAKAIQLQKQKEYEARQAAKKSAAPAPAPRVPRRGGRPADEGVVPDAQRPADLGGLLSTPFLQMRPPVEPPTDDGSGDTGVPPPGVALAPGQVAPPTEALPQPNWQPSTTAPFLAWAYDETVVEGHTYRYQVLYALRSPVYESNVTKPPELAQQFAIWSTPSENGWSQPIAVPPTAEYYLAATNWAAGRTPQSIKIDVFKWAQGKWQTVPFNVSPGDKIGDVQAGIDYGTNVTVVDFKYDPRGNDGAGRPYVLLLTADGRLIERDPTADRNNVRMLSLKAFIQSQTPPPVAPAAGTPAARQPGQPNPS